MKNVLTIASLFAMLATAASATDLPSKKTAPLPPARPVAAVEAPSNWYAGVNAGGNVRQGQSLTDTPAVVGAVVGYKFSNAFAIEAAVEQTDNKAAFEAKTRGTVNGVATLGSFSGFRPYVLAGVGVQSHDFFASSVSTQNIYNVGGGVKYAVTKNVDVDARYRYVNTFNGSERDSNIVTVGLNYNF
jgi:opacity protein-like surface antigen